MLRGCCVSMCFLVRVCLRLCREEQDDFSVFGRGGLNQQPNGAIFYHESDSTGNNEFVLPVYGLKDA